MTKVKKIWFIVILTLSFTLLCVGSAFLVSSFCGNQETISPTAEVGENKLDEHDCDCDHCHDDCEGCDGCDHCHKENEYEQGSLASAKLSPSTKYYKNDGKFYTRTSSTSGGTPIMRCTQCGKILYGSGFTCYHGTTCSCCGGSGDCPSCGGTGRVGSTATSCLTCEGSGICYVCDGACEVNRTNYATQVGTHGGTTNYTYTNIDNSNDVVTTTTSYEVATGFYVSFNKNQANVVVSGGTVSGSMSNQWFLHDHRQRLNDNSYSLSGHDFNGWTLVADSWDPVSSYFSRSSSQVESGGTVTLYAVWRYIVAEPTVTSATRFDYNGSPRTLGISYNSTYVSVTGNQYTAAGNYTAVCSLKDTKKTCWSGGGTSNKTFKWYIMMAGYGVELEYTISPTEYTYNGSAKKPTVSNVKQKLSAAWNGSTATQPAGSGTEDDPYLIETGANLRWIRNNGTNSSGIAVGKYFKQTANIDLNNKPWTPIGYWDDALTSRFHYDGGGYVIRGFYINQSTSSFRGLFHRLCGDSYVKNLTIYGSMAASSYSGAIVGEIRDYGGLLENVHSYVDCTFYGSMCGGIVGLANIQNIINCSFYGTIRCSQYRTGGVAGHGESSRLYGCSNYGTITVDTSLNTPVSTSENPTGNADTKSYIGGVCGYNGRLYDCANYGTIQSTSTFSATCYVGGIVGYTSSASRCFNVGTISFSKTTNVKIGAMSGDRTPDSTCYFLSTCGADYAVGGGTSTTGRLSASKMKSTSNGTKPSSFDSGYSSSGYWAFRNGQYPKNSVDYNYAPLWHNFTSSDYTVSYADNVMPGTEAKVIVTTKAITSESGKVMLASTATVKTFTIKGVTFTPTCSMQSYEYGKTFSEPSVSDNTSEGNATFYYNTTNSNTGGTEWLMGNSSTQLAPGLYYMYVVVEANGIYAECSSAPVAFYVYVETPSLRDESLEYTGSTITNTANYNSTYINTPSGISGQNYGTYPVTFTTKQNYYLFSNGTQTYSDLSWTITTAENTISNFSMSGWTYGGTASNPTGTARWGSITYSYKKLSADDSTYTTTKPTNAGVYVIRAVSASSGNNYTSQTLTLEFAILQQKLTKVTIAENPTYSGQSVSPTLNSYSSSVMTKTGEVDAVNVKLTGSYEMTIALTSLNYCWSDDTVGPLTLTWNVVPKDISDATIKLSQNSYLYDGGVHKPDVSVELNM